MSKTNKTETADKNGIEAMIMDTPDDKYHSAVLASYWAKHLRKKDDQYKHTPHAQLINAALGDILSGKVKKEEVLEAMTKDEKEAAVKESKKPAVALNLEL